MPDSNVLASRPASLALREALSSRGSSPPAIHFEDEVIGERFEKLVDEWIESATEGPTDA